MSNTSQDTALSLSPFCSEETISNLGAATTPHAEDPLHTVYGYGAALSRQLWYKLINTSGQQAYARFTLTNPEDAEIDLTAAIYRDNPPTGPVPFVRSDGNDGDYTDRSVALFTGESLSFGSVIEAGQTIWLEIGSYDGSGHGWDGDLTLEWQLLTVTTYDTPDSGYEGETEFTSGHFDNSTFRTIHSYCKAGDLHFAVYYFGFDPTVEVIVWTEGGGTPSIYGVTPDGVELAGIKRGIGIYGPPGPLLRTDGENVWLVLFGDGPVGDACGGSDPVPANKVGVYLWTGSGFSLIGVQNSACVGVPSGSTQPALGGLSAAAGSAEPGVLHVAWSESGPNSCTINGDGNNSAILQRVTYSKWSTSAFLLESDLSTVTGTTDAFGVWTGSASGITNFLLVTNPYGSPVVFVGGPTTRLDMRDPGTAATLQLGSVIDMWLIDDTTGAPTLAQSFDASISHPGSTLFAGAPEYTIFGTRQPPQHTISGKNVIFFDGVWVGGSSSGILVVPADGSAAITEANLGFGPVFTAAKQDVYFDGDNLWNGTGYYEIAGSGIDQYSVECPTGFPQGFSNADPIYIVPGGMELYYDAPSDSFYTLGGDSSGSPTFYAPLKIPILRDYLICSVGACMAGGLHVWYRL